MGRAARAKPLRLANKLALIREACGLSQQTLVDRLKSHMKQDNKPRLHPQNISGFETGEREPSLLILLAYARFARINMEVLIDDDLDLPTKLSRIKIRPKAN